MTNYLDFCRDHFNRVYLTDAAAGLPEGQRAAERAREVWSRVEPIASRSEVPEQFRNRATIVIDDVRGVPLGRCPGSPGHLCCNYQTIDLYVGCNLGCSYCIMNSYLNYAPIVVQANTGLILDRIEAAGRVSELESSEIRVGSGEVGDSMLLDPVFRLNEEIIRGVSDLSNVRYEVKTKTDYVDHLLDVDRKGRAVVGFSLNPPGIVSSEEGLAASVEERIKAAEACTESGYQVSFHFDPIIMTPEFPADYNAVIDRIGRIPDASIAWISMGTIRFPPSLHDTLRRRTYLSAEFVPGTDGKMRYLQRERRKIYTSMLHSLRETTAAPVYLCMESEAMWKQVFGATPDRISELTSIFEVETMKRKPGGRST